MPKLARSIDTDVLAIDTDVLAVLAAGTSEGDRFYLPPRQLDRKLYEKTNGVLKALGGAWNRKAGAHLFGEPCIDIIESAVDSGSYTRPDDMGWFPTPSDLAHMLVDMAGVREGMAVLEPSGGQGAIVRELHARGAVIRTVELDDRRADSLSQLVGSANLIRGDFLQVDPTFQVDAIVMNPPFAKRADIHHVTHALKFLKSGGRLVSVMSAGVTFREDRLTQDFRSRVTAIETLPEGSFKQSGTEVHTVVVTIQT